ncbi:hypothetical protein NDN08_000186 [Rhodosorus marinus]|uniref:peptidylprolyl isomerase n=1 Tax=Rhodosorus marinus TaxID=101924 RepID=A0AAV8UHT5_9RHOD|nr:hypothetical protein NDN08_000186 [Rhodosorus marinus]
MDSGFVVGSGGVSRSKSGVRVCTTRREFVQIASGTLISGLLIGLPLKSDAKTAKVVKLDSGLEYIDEKIGQGSSPRPGDLVIVNYVGYLSNGKVFDNSESPGRKPLAFRFGQNQVIPGWEEGMADMKPGGVRKLVVPAKLAYGDRGVCVEGQGCLIQPGETLSYDIQLLRVAISPI